MVDSCCWNKVGLGDDWVEKTHIPEDDERIEAAWLSQSLSGAAPLAAAQQRSGSSSTCISEWREGYNRFAAAGDVSAMASLGQEIQTALDDPGKLSGQDREAGQKLQKKASKAASGGAQQLREKSESTSGKAAVAAIAAEAKSELNTWAVVVDLDGTCAGLGTCEFPAIVLDTRSGCEVGRFYRWVRAETSAKGITSNPGSKTVTFPNAFIQIQRMRLKEDQGILLCCGDFDASALYKIHTSRACACSFWGRVQGSEPTEVERLKVVGDLRKTAV